MICNEYAEANNKFLKSYNTKKPTSYIIYLVPNSLYGHFMMQLVLSEMLYWVNQKDFNLKDYSNDSQIGCFLELDLDYPDDLPDFHNYYPLKFFMHFGQKF